MKGESGCRVDDLAVAVNADFRINLRSIVHIIAPDDGNGDHQQEAFAEKRNEGMMIMESTKTVKNDESTDRLKVDAQHDNVPQCVTLSCDGDGGGPGLAWDSCIWFIGNDKSYRMRTLNEEGKTILLKRSTKPLTWRQMAADIQKKNNVGLGGDLLNYVRVYGLEGWQQLILKLAWCKFDCPAEKQLEFLLKAKDETITSLNKSIDASQVEDALWALGSAISDTWNHSILEQGIQELASMPHESIEAWRDAMETWMETHDSAPPNNT